MARNDPPAASALDHADYAYQLERAGILSSAVGMARLALRDGDAAKARNVLDEASIKCSALLAAAIQSDGCRTCHRPWTECEC